MKFTVRSVDGVETKSVQEQEQELLKKHEEAQKELELQGNQDNPPASDDDVDIDDSKVLQFFEKKYGKQVDSIESLFKPKEELPEDVSKFLEFKKETGRGFDDFIKANRNFDNESPDNLLKEYYLQTEEGLDEEDVLSLIDERFSYDEDIDDEKEVKRKQRERKKEIAKAKEFLLSQTQKYRVPLESSYGSLSEEDKQALKAYKEYMAKSRESEDSAKKSQEFFLQKTNELFSNEFKGFEFKVGEKNLRFSPGDSQELKKNQSDINNFIMKFVDEKGFIKDAEGYHRALAIAMNPEKFAKFFYEQGAADSADSITRKVKNVNFSERKAPENRSQGGFSVQPVSAPNSFDSGLKIKVRK